jgi:hypothetical protein
MTLDTEQVVTMDELAELLSVGRNIMYCLA